MHGHYLVHSLLTRAIYVVHGCVLPMLGLIFIGYCFQLLTYPDRHCSRFRLHGSVLMLFRFVFEDQNVHPPIVLAYFCVEGHLSLNH